MHSQDFNRSDRLSDQIRTEVSFILQKEVKDPRLKGLTIIKVDLSKDIKKAYILFSALNSFNDIDLEEVRAGLEKAKGFIRSMLGKRLEIKRIPELFFDTDQIQS
ncbi:MAG: 30S ribosome-binding factor RbfA [Pseudomonadota bacterium]|nr:30S ribosome-binding factor RbfA [Pseudomonadota bacterium]|tara:strand:+ start:2143 stop:2457 length:315 start_codon:yes stop_codon:yes gene_type:complete